MPTPLWMASFDWGSAAGIANGSSGAKMFDSTGGNINFSSTSPRTGAYCFQCLGTSVASNAKLTTATLGSQGVLVCAGAIRFPTLPTNDLDVITLETGSGAMAFIYDTASNKLVADSGGGQIFSSQTLVANAWFWLEFRATVSSTTWSIDWKFYQDGTAEVTQLQASTGGKTNTTFSSFDFGRTGTETGTVDYDDWYISGTSGDYPLGQHNIRMLKVNGASEIGTANATAHFTANGTINSTFVGATVVTALSEVPPLIGATATGWAQRVVGATNAAQFDMETYALQSGESISGLRLVAVGWSASALANNIEVRAWNGSAETVLFPLASPTFTNSTTTPGWLCKIYTGVTNQTQLDALAVRAGYSTDISPQPGFHAVYFDVAVKQAVAGGSFDPKKSSAFLPWFM